MLIEYANRGTLLELDGELQCDMTNFAYDGKTPDQ